MAAEPECVDCGQVRTVMITQELRISPRMVRTWRVCARCWLKGSK